MTRQWCLVTSCLVLSMGCNVNTPRGPGISEVPNVSGVSNTTTAEYRPTLGVPDEAFSLSVPATSIRLTVGESARVAVSIKRGRNFQEDVTLTISGLPDGVSVQPETPMIKAGDPEAPLDFHANDDAATGTYKITVVGHPSSGADARSETSLTISR